jgi:hypothetical protein
MAAAASAAMISAAGQARADALGACVDAHLDSQKLRETGKLVEARARLVTCAADACPTIVRRDCGSWLDEVDRMIPTVVFIAKDGAGNDLSAVRVRVDGVLLTERLDGPAVRVDPGEHVFEFNAADRTPLSKKLVVREGVKDRQEVIVFGEAVSAGSEKRPSSNETGATIQPNSAGATQRALGLAVGGAGVVGIAIGSWFGLSASSSWSRQQRECSGPLPTQCPEHDQAVRDHEDTVRAGTISTVAFVVGGAAVVAGAWLFLTAPRSQSVTRAGVRVRPSVGALHLVGTF